MSAEVAALALPPHSRWGDLRRRLLSTALFVPPLLVAIVLGGAVWMATVALVAALLGWEWARLCRAPAARALRPALPLGLAWIGLAATAMLALRLSDPAGFANTLFLGLVVAATDVGAYAFGRILGGARLAPRISPNKTWAGALGGLASAMAVGGAAGYALQPAGLGVPVAAVPVAALLGLLAIAGDLFESWMKRRCDVKDTSGLLPGHGGLLDRLDGLLAVAPVAALLAQAAPHGLPLWVLA